MADTSTCTARRCGAVTSGLVSVCPNCGGPTISSRRTRVLGWVLVVLGLSLVTVMSYITYALYPTLTRAGVHMGEGGRWSGTAAQAAMVLNLFWMIIAFGALCVAGGTWQIATGRRNRVLMILALIGGATIAIYAWETTEGLRETQADEESRRFIPDQLPPNGLDAEVPHPPQ